MAEPTSSVTSRTVAGRPPPPSVQCRYSLRCAEHPAASATTRSHPAKAATFKAARRRVWAAAPSWAAKAPQQTAAPGTTTRYPAITASPTAARWTSPNSGSITHPGSRPTVARAIPSGSTIRPAHVWLRSARSPASGRPRREGSSFGNLRPKVARRAITMSNDRLERPRPTTRWRSRRRMLGRCTVNSARAPSMARPKGTRPGHTASQARHCRQNDIVYWNHAGGHRAQGPQTTPRGARHPTGEPEGRTMRQAEPTLHTRRQFGLGGSIGRHPSH